MENFRGSIFMVIAMLGFALEDMFIKQMAGSLPIGQILILLGIGGALIFGGLAKHNGDRLWSRDLWHPTILIRNLGEILGTMGFVTAITLTTISSASAILQATPLIVTIGAAFFLGETVGWRRWSAISVGLFGVLLVIRPGVDGFDINSLFAVQAVLGLAMRDLATRRVPATITTRQLATYAFMSIIPTGAAMLWMDTTGATLVVPDITDTLRLIAGIGIGVGAYYALVMATRVGDSSVIAPFRYSRLVFALIIGTFIFHERPDALTLIGAIIIVTSGIYTLWREARLRRASIG